MATPIPSLEVSTVGVEGGDLLHALHRACFVDDTGEAWRREDLIEVLGLNSTSARILSERLLPRQLPEPVGYAIYRIVGGECELLSIGVHPDARRRGLGRQLLDAIMSACRLAGVGRMFLEVRDDNVAAFRLYRGLGFAVVGRRTAYYRAGDGRRRDALTMSRAITDKAPDTSSP